MSSGSNTLQPAGEHDNNSLPPSKQHSDLVLSANLKTIKVSVPTSLQPTVLRPQWLHFHTNISVLLPRAKESFPMGICQRYPAALLTMLPCSGTWENSGPFSQGHSKVTPIPSSVTELPPTLLFRFINPKSPAELQTPLINHCRCHTNVAQHPLEPEFVLKP